MAGYNRIVLVGNLTRDPEYKQLTSGQAVCRLGLASNRQFKNRQTGTMVQEVCYVDIDVWGPQAESCRQYLQKGRSVLIEGRLKFDSWKDQEGQNRNKHSVVADRVVFLSSSNSASDTVTGAMLDNDEDQPRQKTAAGSEFDAELEKDILGQIDSIKHRQTGAAKKSPVKSKQAALSKQESADELSQEGDAGEIAFNDEPPFQDDLPF
jgi:single-strand DNA-binding protein